MNITNLFKEYKSKKIPISVITCYDYSFSKIISETDIDAILVGDSLGMVFQGNDSTLPVTLDDMIYHCRAVKRGSGKKPVICDLPFMTYQVDVKDGLRALGKVMQQTNCEGVKIEGANEEIFELIQKAVEIGIPVMGHIGLTPQSFHTLGGFRLQGKEESSYSKYIEQARNLEKAGCFGVVLEMVPEILGQYITESLSIPTIGIGGGRKVDGQVLVITDMLGMTPNFKPKFLKKYNNLFESVKSSFNQYNTEVKNRTFPDESNIY